MAISREKKQLQKWQEIKTYLNEQYHEPDTNSLRVALAQYAAHFYLHDKPVWCFILGASGTGKSEIIDNGIKTLPYVISISILGENSFLSGYGEKTGILLNLEKLQNIQNGVLLFNDFSTFLGLREETRKILQSQMRYMYDGSLQKSIGNKEKQISWTGKVTIIANCTPNLEEHWSVGNVLGERFLYCRYKPPTVTNDLRDKALRKMNNQIDSRYPELLKEYADFDKFESITDLSDEFQISTGLFELASLVEWVRTNIVRDNYASNRPVTAVHETAGPTRIFKSAIQLAKGSATLNARQLPNNVDLSLARKVLLDTIPANRFKVISFLIKQMNYKVSTFDNETLRSGIKLTPITLLRELENLSVIEILTITRDKFSKQVKQVTLKESFKELIRNSKILKNY